MKRLLPVILVLLLSGIITMCMTASDRVERVYYRDKVIVLLYHDIQDSLKGDEHSSSTITVKQFREHLSMLKKQGFRIISMDMLIEFMLQGRSAPPNAVVLTFDDGYESFYTAAFPVLKEFAVTASNFIVGISTDLFNPNAEPHLKWEQLRELKKSGMGIYSHTYNLHQMIPTHPVGKKGPALISRHYLAQRDRFESDEEYLDRVSADLQFMEKRFGQELGKQRKLLAFPYGAYTAEVEALGRKLGIDLFFTTEEGINEPGGSLVRRINAGEPYMTAEALWHCLRLHMEGKTGKAARYEYQS